MPRKNWSDSKPEQEYSSSANYNNNRAYSIQKDPDTSTHTWYINSYLDNGSYSSHDVQWLWSSLCFNSQLQSHTGQKQGSAWLRVNSLSGLEQRTFRFWHFFAARAGSPPFKPIFSFITKMKWLVR